MLQTHQESSGTETNVDFVFQVGGFLPGGIAVRGVSGGERKRLGIATGLIATPSIMFLDEPTTGAHLGSHQTAHHTKLCALVSDDHRLASSPPLRTLLDFCISFTNLSGLDSFAALRVTKHLRALADEGHTLVITIHQPRAAIWQLFDKVSIIVDVLSYM